MERQAGGDSFTIVCGLDRLGLRTAEELCQLGETVVVLASDTSLTFADRVQAAGARLVDGSSQEEDDLVRAGVKDARCLVLTEDSDLGNLHAALNAQEINPKLRVVLRMFNAELAQRASDLLTDTRVLSLSSVAAPTLAAEALGDQAGGSIEIWGRQVILQEAIAEDTRVLCELDQASVLADGGSAAEIAAALRARRRRGRRAWQTLRTFADRRLAVVLGLVAALSTLSVIIFARFAGFNVVDAIYFTFTTISTVGYGDFNLMNQGWGLKLYDVGFMLFGATALAAFYALVTDAVVGARLSAALGVPHGKTKNHVVVCGLGNVGFRAAEHLVLHGTQVTAVDLNDRGRFVHLARRLGIPVLTGDALLADNLRLCSVESARAVIAASSDDVSNLEIALAARELNPKARLVARVFDAELARRARTRFGIHACHSVAGLASPYFAGASLGEDVETVIHVKDRSWLLAEATVAGHSPADGMLVSALEDSAGASIVAVRQAGQASWRPEKALTLGPGQEILYVTGRPGLHKVRAATQASS